MGLVVGGPVGLGSGVGAVAVGVTPIPEVGRAVPAGLEIEMDVRPGSAAHAERTQQLAAQHVLPLLHQDGVQMHHAAAVAGLGVHQVDHIAHAVPGAAQSSEDHLPVGRGVERRADDVGIGVAPVDGEMVVTEHHRLVVFERARFVFIIMAHRTLGGVQVKSLEGQDVQALAITAAEDVRQVSLGERQFEAASGAGDLHRDWLIKGLQAGARQFLFRHPMHIDLVTGQSLPGQEAVQVAEGLGVGCVRVGLEQDLTRSERQVIQCVDAFLVGGGAERSAERAQADPQTGHPWFSLRAQAVAVLIVEGKAGQHAAGRGRAGESGGCGLGAGGDRCRRGLGRDRFDRR